MSAHTPGPWSTDGVSSRGEWVVILGPSGERLATMYETDFDGNETANALLMAAAPDMLAALKGLRAAALSEYVSCDCPNASICRPSIKAADAAIAKAEGES